MSLSNASRLGISSTQINRLLKFMESFRLDLKKELKQQRYIPWIQNDVLSPTSSAQLIGLLKSEFATSLASEYPSIFAIRDRKYSNQDNEFLTLTNQFMKSSFDERVATLATVTLKLCNQGVIKGWRNELLPISTSFSSPPIVLLERASCAHFGVRAYGVHVNGFVREKVSGGVAGRISHIWVGTRSKAKSTWPGMLDHIVAGAIPYGVSVQENVVKECEEEAGIGRDLATSAQPTGAVSYAYLDEDGNARRDVLYCYDLELPADFTPRPVDGEVERFDLRPVEWVVEKVVEGMEYKPNCNLVLIDFFVRHGFITPDCPRYLELISGLRDADCS
eukprot:gene22701-30983_t